MTYRDRVASFFDAHRGEWVDGIELERIGGRYAWRSRVSDCRTQLGMQVENRLRKRADGSTASEYRYTGMISPTSAFLGRDTAKDARA